MRSSTWPSQERPRPAQAGQRVAGRPGTPEAGSGPRAPAAQRRAGRRRRRGARSGPGRPRRPAGHGTCSTALDPDQLAAATADSPLMIIAGPGTGKTRTLAHRIALGAASLRASRRQASLAITFTRRAAEEMRARLAALLPGPEPDVTVTTFHGLGLMILREQAEQAGLTPGFGVADDAARLEIAAELTGSARDGRRLLAEAADRACAAGSCSSRRWPPGTWWTSTASSSCLRRCSPPSPRSRNRCATAGRGSAWTSTRTSTPPSTSCCGCWPATAAG